jgi:glycosyltransferase involved in cell wall biosynthesis
MAPSDPVTPILTIGLPVYNAAPFLEDSLRSIFAQTFADWELIAIDDGSSDASAAILQRLKDPRVRALADGEHRGLGARLNQIIALAAGRYIARMDADDLMHPDRLARQLSFLEENAAIDVVGCGLISFDARERAISVRRLPAQHAQITADPLRGFAVAHATALGRSEWWKKHPYNEGNRGCEDWELWFESYTQSRFANLADLLYFYREPQAYSFRGYARDKLELASRLWRNRARFGLAAMGAAAAQCARVPVYAAAHILGTEGALIRRRGQPPADSEREMFTRALEQIRSAALPA